MVIMPLYILQASSPSTILTRKVQTVILRSKALSGELNILVFPLNQPFILMGQPTQQNQQTTAYLSLAAFSCTLRMYPHPYMHKKKL
jgi:hypothetical protein